MATTVPALLLSSLPTSTSFHSISNHRAVVAQQEAYPPCEWAIWDQSPSTAQISARRRCNSSDSARRRWCKRKTFWTGNPEMGCESPTAGDTGGKRQMQAEYGLPGPSAKYPIVYSIRSRRKCLVGSLMVERVGNNPADAGSSPVKRFTWRGDQVNRRFGGQGSPFSLRAY